MLRVRLLRRARLVAKVGLLALLLPALALAQPRPTLTALPALPPLLGKTNPGVAGGFAGLSGGMLLLAGGANFPNGYPWEGGQKVWHRTIYALPINGTPQRWQVVGELGHALGYGASVTWRDGFITLGGNDAQRRYAEVVAYRWDARNRQLRADTLPPLLRPLANLSAACLGNQLYVFGGESERGAERTLYVLNLLRPETGWKPLADLPGPARAYAVLVATNGRLYVAGGRYTADGQTRVFADAYAYTPAQNRWEQLPDLPTPLSAHSAVATPDGSVLVIGGDTGERLGQIERVNNQIAQSVTGPVRDSLTFRRNALQRDHPGFSKTVWVYTPRKRRWTRWRDLPFAVPVTTTPVAFPGGFVLPSGEVSPGVRTPTTRFIPF
ncbi:galactose oxidase [Rudanella paleaurantiibacter]|uniref:Galactose oxidase n=1 Tax=Rudanella paleaurantiibacter TaxID=2614655 RepID=A0A7J5TT42_9BACT|nr:kelch repeat-containing protein [Rudanella paleaurantiibacter]KAB7726876.1 galactose oxidase [Rudanella paleaurantiibacter]